MTKHWTKIEPIFLSAVLMLVGWICFETVNHKTDIAVVKEKVNTIQEDISEIKTDIHKMATAAIEDNTESIAQKN